jgi:hypothetical protein
MAHRNRPEINVDFASAILVLTAIAAFCMGICFDRLLQLFVPI